MNELPKRILIDFRFELSKFRRAMSQAQADADIDPILELVWSAMWNVETAGAAIEDSVSEIVNAYSEDGYGVHRLSLVYEAITDLAVDVQRKIKELGLYLEGMIPYDFETINQGCISIRREDI
jgi:hypothetical protein